MRLVVTTKTDDSPSARVRAFRKALGLTQLQVAERSKGFLTREDANKLELRSHVKTEKAQNGLMNAFDLTREQVVELLSGAKSIEEMLSVRLANLGGAAGGPALLRNQTWWGPTLAAAQALRRLPPEAWERVARMPLLDGLDEDPGPAVLADLARDLHEWSERSVKSERRPR